MLAIGDTKITLGGSIVVLRPTLRAAIRVHRELGGFDKAMEALDSGSISAISTVIRECSVQNGGGGGVIEILNRLADMPLCIGIEVLAAPLVNFVLQLAYQGNGGASAEAADDADPMTFEDHHARLYQLGTGWLGWTAEQTYSATATEIVEAYKGRVDFVSTVLKAVFGDATREPEGEQPAELFNAKLSGILATATARLAQPDKAA